MMSHLCRHCQRSFSRSDNRDRHEKHSCLNPRDDESHQSSLGVNFPPSIAKDSETSSQKNLFYPRECQMSEAFGAKTPCPILIIIP